MTATDIPARLTTSLSDRYRIGREIGAGGMATVYLAEDLKHRRSVALKVLRPELAAVLGTERFLAEINVTANLQHPHLLPLFDSGSVDGLLYYVMPYVAGESLRSRLERELQLPVDEAVRIAADVASALHYAHRHGVVHRDLKPENILLHEGQPLVTDFGIALAVSNAGGARITQTGLSLGTPAYMSPEQASGDRIIDARSDIYSLAAVLFEMLTGEPPHTGPTAQAIIARLLTDEPPDVQSRRSTVPDHVDAAIRKALAKLPADRFSSVQLFADALVDPGVSIGQIAGTRAAHTRRRKDWLRVASPWLAALAILAAFAAWRWLSAGADGSSGSASPPRARFVIAPTDSVTGLLARNGPSIALSPDGSVLVYAWAGPRVQLYARPLDDLEARPLRGTDNAQRVSFSPDGRWVAFVDNGLKRIPIAGGPVETMAPLGEPYSWGDDGVVLIGGPQGTLRRVSAAGGIEDVLIAPDTARGETAFTWPHVLPGGKAALFVIRRADYPGSGMRDGELAVVSLNDRHIQGLGIQGTNPRYLPTGHVVYGRVDGSGTIAAVPFDIRRLAVTGPPATVLENVVIRPGGATELAVSPSGVMAYVEGNLDSRMELVDREGGVRRLSAPARFFRNPRVSPDGKRIAVAIGEKGGFDIWVYDIDGGTLTRLTTDGHSARPEWSPDGARIAWVHSHEQRRAREIRSQAWDGSGSIDTVLDSHDAPNGFTLSPRGNALLYTTGGESSRGTDIWLAQPDSARAGRPFISGPGSQLEPAFSRDGRWVAYQSDHSGRPEVYVRPFPGPGGQIQISTNGGTSPVWSPTTNEVFYRAAEGYPMAATVESGPTFRVVRRDSLRFQGFSIGDGSRGYDVLPNGKEFVAQRGVSHRRIVVVLRWFDELRERMAAAKQ